MSWRPRYRNGKLAIVPGADEDFAEEAIYKRIREIETSIRDLLGVTARNGEIDVSGMLRVFAQIHSLFGVVSLTVTTGPADPESLKKWEELSALDERLNAELDAR